MEQFDLNAAVRNYDYTKTSDLDGRIVVQGDYQSSINYINLSADKVYATAITNAKGEDVAQQQKNAVLQAGFEYMKVRAENSRPTASEVLLGTVGAGGEGLAKARINKLTAADAAFAAALSSAYKAAGDEKQAENKQQSANTYNKGTVEADSGSGITFIPGAGGVYTLLAPVKTFFPTGKINIKDEGLAGYLNGIYRIGIAVATGLALVMIVIGGLEYVSVDSVQGKSNGREHIKNAVIGLLLALCSFIILQQVNPSLLKSDLGLANTGSTGTVVAPDVDLTTGQSGGVTPIPGAGGQGGYVIPGSQNPTGGNWGGYTNLRQLLSSLPGGSRSTDGSLIFTNYWNGDTNTNQQRGNNCNLLVSGSVALSPDLISRYKPAKGSAVYVNSLLVGYYDDATGATTQGYVGGTLIRNTIDIYDPNRSLGSILKKMPAGSWNLSFGGVRPQQPNPCN